jgi:hypothetical protein
MNSSIVFILRAEDDFPRIADPAANAWNSGGWHIFERGTNASKLISS